MLDFLHQHRHDDGLYTTEFITNILPEDDDTPVSTSQALFTSNLPGFHRALDAYATWYFEKNSSGEIGIFSLTILQDIFSRFMNQSIEVLNYFLFSNIYFHIHGDIQDEDGKTYEDLTYNTWDNTRDLSDRDNRAYLYFLDNLLESLILESLTREIPEEKIWDTLCDNALLESLNKLYNGEITAENFEEIIEGNK